MIIRKAKVSDVDFIYTVGKKVKEFQVDPKVGGFWSKKDIKNWILSKDDVCLIAEEKGEIVGFALFSHHVPTAKVVFENAWVKESFRSKGIASKLFKEGLKELRKKGADYICSLTKEDAFSSLAFQKKNRFNKGYKFFWFHRKI